MKFATIWPLKSIKRRSTTSSEIKEPVTSMERGYTRVLTSKLATLMMMPAVNKLRFQLPMDQLNEIKEFITIFRCKH